ncbi:serine hydrolase [Clostridium sporogenes]|uniref:serine hydrolase domain-containing protein n=1 Tax=Clostridium sporogenes TaxID=1509 RepID=UPI0013D797CB|nr:serine hydrolase [Clostridium sporogenes]
MERNYWPTTEWKVQDPKVLKMDSEKLLELEPVIKSQYSNINGIVVVKNGYIAYEKYFNGYGANDTHHVASVTKSIISALIGIAIEEGYIKSVDQKVLDFFPEYIPNDDGIKKEITIGHLLTMTAPYPFEDWHEPLDKMCMQCDWVKYTLDMLGQKGNIGVFKYSTAGAHLLSAIITKSTGKSAREFGNEYLFEPIGMKVIPNYEMKSFGFDDLFGKNIRGWVKDQKGNSTGGWGLTLTPRDMARFGFLYLNYGAWDSNQILSKKWIDESIAMNSNNYGYLWWLFKEEGVFAYSAMGDGGNVICCIPEKDIVVAIASEFIMNPSDRWTLIKEHIIPAIKK